MFSSASFYPDHSLGLDFRLLLRNSYKSVLTWPNRTNKGTRGGWKLAQIGWKVLDLAPNLALKAGFLAEVIASLRGKALWALSALALLHNAFPSSEVASLLAPEGALALTS